MSRTEADGARTFYEWVSAKTDVVDNWGFLLEHVINPEVRLTVGARLRGDALELQLMKSGRRIVSSVIAAELFPDRNPPEMLIARSELETHDNLRNRYGKTHPDTEPRVSGNIITELGGKKFFQMDAIMLSVGATTFWDMRSKLPDVAEILLSKGLVPLDSECKIVPLR